MAEGDLTYSEIVTKFLDAGIARKIGAGAFQTATGEIRYSQATYTIYQLSDAILRVHDMHNRLTNQKSILEISEDISNFDLGRLYRFSVMSILSAISTASKDDFSTYILEISKSMQLAQSAGGLDAIILTLVLSAPSELSSELIRFLDIWRGLDFDHLVGGGLRSSIGLDGSSGRMYRSNPSQMQTIFGSNEFQESLRSHGLSPHASLSVSPQEFLAMRLSRYGAADPNCLGLYQLRGAIIGFNIGTAAGIALTRSPAGALGLGFAAASLGHSVGESIGNRDCPPEDSSTNDQGDSSGEGARPSGGDWPPEPSLEDDAEGCIAPYWDDLRMTDPYRKFALREYGGLIVRGPGLRSLLLKDSGYNSVRNDVHEILSGSHIFSQIYSWRSQFQRDKVPDYRNHHRNDRFQLGAIQSFMAQMREKNTFEAQYMRAPRLDPKEDLDQHAGPTIERRVIGGSSSEVGESGGLPSYPETGATPGEEEYILHFPAGTHAASAYPNGFRLPRDVTPQYIQIVLESIMRQESIINPGRR